MKNSDISNLRIVIIGDMHKLIIGENVIYKSGYIHFESKGGKIDIGENCTIEDADFYTVEGKQIRIGNDCMLSAGIDVRTGDSHSIIDLETNKRINQSKDIILGNHVWIGKNATILKGVSLANNMIVGCGSIVTKSFDGENSIITGIPAKIIKQNVTWDRNLI